MNASSLSAIVTAFPTFELSALQLPPDLDFILPSNLRLGHLAEKVVSGLLKASSNYNVLYENVQLQEDKRTIGELDFIVKEVGSEKLTHIELAYKFYLLDPSISTETVNNWIGPNRNDSLKEKLEKLKTKQFPLLNHRCANAKLTNINIQEVDQALCFLVSLYLPLGYKEQLSPEYEKLIKGYHVDFETFKNLDLPEVTYYIPPKREWGMDPSENGSWYPLAEIVAYLQHCMQERQAPLCWQKHQGSYSQFFIVWW